VNGRPPVARPPPDHSYRGPFNPLNPPPLSHTPISEYSKTASRLAITLLLACTASCGTDAGEDWTLEPNQCSLSAGTATIGGRPAQWTSCRAHYYADGQVLTIQLMRAGSSGSFLFPGAGWLNISVNLNTAERTTLPLRFAGSDVPAAVPVGVLSVTYTSPTGSRTIATGQMPVGDNNLSPGFPNVNFEGQLDGVMVGGEAAGGAFAVHTAAATGGGGSGGGSTCTNHPECDGYTRQCSAGGLAPCYCAAACVCHACGDAACERQNRASAQPLGTTCSY